MPTPKLLMSGHPKPKPFSSNHIQAIWKTNQNKRGDLDAHHIYEHTVALNLLESSSSGEVAANKDKGARILTTHQHIFPSKAIHFDDSFCGFLKDPLTDELIWESVVEVAKRESLEALERREKEQEIEEAEARCWMETEDWNVNTEQRKAVARVHIEVSTSSEAQPPDAALPAEGSRQTMERQDESEPHPLYVIPAAAPDESVAVSSAPRQLEPPNDEGRPVTKREIKSLIFEVLREFFDQQPPRPPPSSS